MTTGTVRFVGSKLPGNDFVIGLVTRGANHPSLVSLIIRSLVRIGRHRSPSRCSVATVACLGGHEMGSGLPYRQRAVVAICTRGSCHDRMVHGRRLPSGGAMAAVAGDSSIRAALVLRGNPSRRHTVTGLTSSRCHPRMVERGRDPGRRRVARVAGAWGQAALVPCRDAA